MASKKAVKKVATAAAGAKKSVSKSAEPVARVGRVPPSPVVPLKKAVLPVARTCPLVLDGEMDAADFSPNRCLSCDEFDCRFCAAERGSGLLRSRLFACEESDDAEEDDAWDSDLDADESEDTEGDEAEEGDLF